LTLIEALGTVSGMFEVPGTFLRTLVEKLLELSIVLMFLNESLANEESSKKV